VTRRHSTSLRHGADDDSAEEVPERDRPSEPELPNWGMQLQRWYNAGQPQTLQLAQILLYTNAVIELLSLLFSGGFLPSGVAGGWFLLITVLWIAVLLGQLGGALGIANSRKLGYRVALVVAFLPVVLQVFVLVRYRVVPVSIFTLLFEAALIAALVHPQSRQYQRIWFR
jgi:hypothetical protein